jgi:hypothetical protein
MNGFETIGYFTTQMVFFSGIIFVFGTLFHQRMQVSKVYHFFYRGVVVSSVVVMFVYVVVLVPFVLENNVNYEVFSLNDLLAHIFIPIAILGDYFLFHPKGKVYSFSRFSPYIFVSFFIAYWLVYVFFGGTYSLGEIDVIYPYYFLNIDTVGWSLLVLSTTILFIFVSFINWVYETVDMIVHVRLLTR